MALEVAPSSVQSDGKWRIWYVPTGSNAKSVAILNGATAKSLTYGLTADGWNNTKTQATVEDKRLTLKTDLSRPGRITETLEVTYVRSTDVASAQAVLVEGVEGHLTVRRGIDNDVVWTIAQKVDVLTFVAGVQRPNAPTENGVDTISQTLYITAPTEYEQVLAA
jgi:hypothetical protein